MESRYPVGTKVDVLYQGSWSNATVKEVVSTQQWLIGYDGWSETWDETVGPERIRPRKPWTAWNGVITVVVVAAVIGGAMGVVHLFTGGAAYYGASEHSGVMPRTAHELTRGQAIFVESGGTWYPAVVVRVDDSGHATVHYDGYSASDDESVSLARIRVP